MSEQQTLEQKRAHFQELALELHIGCFSVFPDPTKPITEEAALDDTIQLLEWVKAGRPDRQTTYRFQ